MGRLGLAGRPVANQHQPRELSMADGTRTKTVRVICVKSRYIGDTRYTAGEKYKIAVSLFERYQDDFKRQG